MSPRGIISYKKLTEYETSNMYVYTHIFMCVYIYKNIKIKATHLPYNAAAVKYFIINILYGTY